LHQVGTSSLLEYVQCADSSWGGEGRGGERESLTWSISGVHKFAENLGANSKF